ncbi:MAG: M48 family metalloprotease [Magnetovibrio sp.]|nr:M48 family metalloprotease [Magnetovibrio sp.]
MYVPPSFRALARLLAVVPFLALGACSTNPATGKQSFTAFMSQEDEARIGAEEHPKILKELGGAYSEDDLGAYVASIGGKLAALSELPKIPWRFTVLNDEAVNAFALPGGYVYITRGLLALADNEAEMAGVLAHEIGHVTARHSAQRYSTAMATNIGLTVLGVLGSAAGVPSGVGRVANLGAQVAIQQYSQGQELEADMLGVRYMTRAGYDPRALTSFFRKLKAHSELEARQKGQDGVNHNILSTHPRTADRIKQAIELSKAKAVARPLVKRRAYLNRIDGIVFGDDPSQGVRRGRTFMHPDLRFAFTVPPGFVLFNTPKQVVAFGPSKSRIIFDMANPKQAPRVRSLPNYIDGVWKHGLDVQRIERLDVNGLAGATGEARLSTGDGPRDVRLIAIRADKDQIFRFAFVTPPSESKRLNLELRRTTYSFRRLSASEAAAIQPLRIKMVTVRSGDTVQSMARRFPFERFRREWFRLLNDLKPGDPLVPGRRVKIVAG